MDIILISEAGEITKIYFVIYITVDASGMGQRQLNGTVSKTILIWSEYHEIQSFFFHGLQ